MDGRVGKLGFGSPRPRPRGGDRAPGRPCPRARGGRRTPRSPRPRPRGGVAHNDAHVQRSRRPSHTTKPMRVRSKTKTRTCNDKIRFNSLDPELEHNIEELRETIDRDKSAMTRQLASLTRVDYKGRLPRDIMGFRSLLPGRRKKFLQWASDYRLIAGSPLFDWEWYLASNPDVGANAVDPVFHYLAHGAGERRAPSPNFDGDGYLRSNPDIGSQTNPLVHYLLHGAKEARFGAAPLYFHSADANGRISSPIRHPRQKELRFLLSSLRRRRIPRP